MALRSGRAAAAAVTTALAAGQPMTSAAATSAASSNSGSSGSNNCGSDCRGSSGRSSGGSSSSSDSSDTTSELLRNRAVTAATAHLRKLRWVSRRRHRATAAPTAGRQLQRQCLAPSLSRFWRSQQPAAQSASQVPTQCVDTVGLVPSFESTLCLLQRSQDWDTLAPALSLAALLLLLAD